MRTITKLALASDKENKTRSILVTLTIFLTTLLLTAIGVFGYGLVKDNHENAGRIYGAYYGTFSGVEEEKAADISLRSEFDRIGLSAQVGAVKSANDSNPAIFYVDEDARAMTNLEYNLSEGHFPEKEEEIAGYRSFFRSIGLKEPKLGDTITLQYRKNLQSAYEEAEFVIAGLLDEPENSLYVIEQSYVSRAYYEKHFDAEQRSYTIYFTLDDSVAVNADTGRDVIKKLAASCGMDERYASDNYAYLMWALDPGTETLLGCLAVGLIIILFAVLVIFNIFRVGIVRKIQEYGKIKALGTTRRQMRSMIFGEGMLLAAVGVPAGIVAGQLVGMLVFHIGIRTGYQAAGVDMGSISLFSPLLLIAIAVISFVTVWIALMRPMRIVARISPTEAMRYQDMPGGGRRQKSTRKGRKAMSTMGLTLANLSAHRGRTVSTILTMGLSCVLFMVIANIVGNMDAVYDARCEIEYGDYELDLDYSVGDTAYPENNLDAVLENNPLSEELLARICQMDGVKEVRTQQILYFQYNGRLQRVAVLSEDLFDRERDHGGFMGDITYEQAVQERGILYGWSSFMEEEGYMLGQQMDIELSNGDSDIPYSGKLIGAFGSGGGDFVITDQTYESMGFSNPSYKTFWISCEKGMEEQVEKELAQITGELGHLTLSSYADALELSKASIRLMKGLGYSLCILVAVISFLNMANTLITSTITRKQEFGVLQAVGMTNVQLNRSLQAEGVIFTLGTVIVTLLAGIPAGYALFRYGISIGMLGLHIYHFPVLETVLMIVVLTVFQGILSLVLSKNVKRESLIDRIRYPG